jgi:hypothetical protein
MSLQPTITDASSLKQLWGRLSKGLDPGASRYIQDRVIGRLPTGLMSCYGSKDWEWQFPKGG